MTNRPQTIVQAKWFHHGIVVVIVLAGIVVGLETSPAIMAQYGAMLLALDKLILGVFVLEALLKMAVRLKQWASESAGSGGHK